ncbi:cysteine--tRNA ligase [Candidatus Woesearchaeota archaeon]|nr:cysteine--tRNA ligase [Candidatus Woesearchaeota archaeon]
MALQFYNTFTQKKELFKPIEKNSATMYNCGPTVYNYAHIGNFRAYICSDILKRYLLYKGFAVKQVMNITDVDDKTIRDSQKEGLSLHEFTEKYTIAFFEDLEKLNISKAYVFPRATQHIHGMIHLTQKLLDNEIAYQARDGIYFSISKFRNYGKLSKIKLDETKTGVRVKNDEYDKENAQDFALWKFWTEKDGDCVWESPFGKGRPGWHIECSVMAMQHLAEHFDIHTGGIDLIFPHHENEIAQSEAVTGKKFVNYWLHNEYILVNGKKMSKSLGNFFTLRDLLIQGYKARAIRYLLLSSHYRQQLNFTLQGIDAAEKVIEKFDIFFASLDEVKNLNNTVENNEIAAIIENAQKQFEEAMDDDLEISQGLAVIFEFIRRINVLASENKVGKKNAVDITDFMKKIDSVLGVMHTEESAMPREIIMLAEERERVRKKKDFATSDKLRKEIISKGYILDDTNTGYRLRKKRDENLVLQDSHSK